MADLFGVQVTKHREGYGIVTGNLPALFLDLLPKGNIVKVSFESPTPEGCHYLGRNHPFVEQLCQMVMANTLARQDKRAAVGGYDHGIVGCVPANFIAQRLQSEPDRYV